MVAKKACWGKTPSLLVLRGARHPVVPVLFVSCLDCCQSGPKVGFGRPGLDGSRHGTAGLARKARAGPAHSDCCQEPLAHLLQERHLQPLNELSAAHASVHGAFGRIKIRRVINKLRGLRAENSERCHPPG